MRQCSVKGTDPSWKKLLNIPKLYAKMFRTFYWACLYFFPKIVRTVRDITDDLWRTTFACYHLGYCYALVNRVYEPRCDR